MLTALVLLVALVGALTYCAVHWRLRVLELEDQVACLLERIHHPTRKETEMPAVELSRNADGTWTARIFSTQFTGNYDQCLAWLRAHGECY